jgi:hypothetical protein
MFANCKVKEKTDEVHGHHLSDSAWVDFRGFRLKRFSALHSDSPIPGCRGAVPGSNFQVTFLHRGFPDANRRWGVLAGKQVCPVGAGSSRPGARQHS